MTRRKAPLSALLARVEGLPAVAGVVAGVALQQRIPVAAVSGTFALLLVASAAYLVL